jgi:hypothetical protein
MNFGGLSEFCVSGVLRDVGIGLAPTRPSERAVNPRRCSLVVWAELQVYACDSQNAIKGGFWLNLSGADEQPELDRQWDG